MSTKRKPAVIDLFAGAGGLLLGFEQAGFETVSANENDVKAVEMLRFNYPHVMVDDRGIEKIHGADLLVGQKRGEIDVLIGGPPCQGFSIIGLREHNDPRNNLVFHFLRMLEEIRPKTFLMENVPGMLSTQKGAFVSALIDEFGNVGYEVQHPVTVLHADEFGVPQRRSRVIFMGCRKGLGLKIQYPVPTHRSPRANGVADQSGLFGDPLKPSPTVRDAISDLPDIDKFDYLVDSDETPYDREPVSEYAKMMRGYKKDPDDLSPKRKWDKKICTGCRRTVHGPVLTARCAETPPGQSLPISRLYKLKWDDVANTLRAGTPRERGAYSSPRPIHPSSPRVVSVREGARLQSFPDWIRFHPTKWHGFRQVGNSVPPLLARAIAKQYSKALS
jgi:DNA (cytosine-5)-methyltransferase 1